eukprot:2376243-Lingulodinium_polyedra.AAC.1
MVGLLDGLHGGGFMVGELTTVALCAGANQMGNAPLLPTLHLVVQLLRYRDRVARYRLQRHGFVLLL